MSDFKKYLRQVLSEKRSREIIDSHIEIPEEPKVVIEATSDDFSEATLYVSEEDLTPVQEETPKKKKRKDDNI